MSGIVLVCTHCGKIALQGKVRQVWYGNMQIVLRYHDACFEKLQPMDATLFRGFNYAVPIYQKDNGGVVAK